MAKRKLIRPMVQPKPAGTRCYVPGYTDDATQFAVDQSQLGVAPLAVASAGVKLATGGRVLGVSFKKPSPRVFGGPLVSTVNGFKSRIEGGDVSAAVEMDNARKTAKDKGAWQRIWGEMLPTWRLGSAAVYERIKQLDPSLPVQMPVATAPVATGPTVSPIAPAVPPPPGVTPGGVPSIGPITISLPSPSGGGGPVLMPTPPSQLPGGEPQVPDEVARPQMQQAGMFGGEGMGKLLLPGIGLFILSQVLGKRR